MINVFITDDHKSFVEGVAAILNKEKNIAVVGSASNGSEAIEAVKALKIDVMTLDIDMPGMNGEETLKEIRRINPEIKVLILTSINDKVVVDNLRDMGANGFRNKDAGMADIIHAIVNINSGYSDFVTRYEQKPNRVTLNYSNLVLTTQEKRVVELLSGGYQVKNIAEIMNLSEHTIESHVKTARAKAGAKNVTELVAKAIRHGLI